jgi:hypothetical protein
LTFGGAKVHSENMKIIRSAAFLLATMVHAEVTSFPVIPSATDPEIKQFNDPH